MQQTVEIRKSGFGSEEVTFVWDSAFPVQGKQSQTVPLKQIKRFFTSEKAQRSYEGVNGFRLVEKVVTESTVSIQMKGSHDYGGQVVSTDQSRDEVVSIFRYAQGEEENV